MDTRQALRARTINLAEVTGRDRERWKDLAARALAPNPFLDPAFLHSSHRWMPKAQGIRLVVVEDDRSMTALLPLSAGARTRRLPLTHDTTAGPFLGSFAPYLAPLVDRERAEPALDRLLAHLATRDSAADGLLELTLFPGSGELVDQLLTVAARRGVPVLERYRMERAAAHIGGGGPEWRSRLSSSRRKNLARYARRLASELGPLQGEECGTDPDAFEELVHLEAAGWKGEVGRGYALGLSERKLGWYREMVEELRSHGRLHIFRLRAGDRTVYSSLAFRAGDHLFSTIDAYDETVAHLRPGNVGRAAELDFLDAGPERVTLDPCMHPKYVESAGMFPDRVPLVGLFLAPRGLQNRVALQAAPSLRAMREKLEPVGERLRALVAAR